MRLHNNTKWSQTSGLILTPASVKIQIHQVANLTWNSASQSPSHFWTTTSLSHVNIETEICVLMLLLIQHCLVRRPYITCDTPMCQQLTHRQREAVSMQIHPSNDGVTLCLFQHICETVRCFFNSKVNFSVLSHASSFFSRETWALSDNSSTVLYNWWHEILNTDFALSKHSTLFPVMQLSVTLSPLKTSVALLTTCDSQQ